MSTSFAPVSFPAPRAERATSPKSPAPAASRAASSVLLAAIVSALLVVANQVVDTWSEGHLLAAWIVLWIVAFAALGIQRPVDGEGRGGARHPLEGLRGPLGARRRE